MTIYRPLYLPTFLINSLHLLHRYFCDFLHFLYTLKRCIFVEKKTYKHISFLEHIVSPLSVSIKTSLTILILAKMQNHLSLTMYCLLFLSMQSKQMLLKYRSELVSHNHLCHAFYKHRKHTFRRNVTLYHIICHATLFDLKETQ